MKSKGQDELLDSSSEESNSEDDEDGWKITEEAEKEFFKTLSKIKSKDPKIYEKNVEFFKDIPIPEKKVTNAPKSNPFTLRDYERNIIIEKGGELSDEEPNPSNQRSQMQPTYVEEQESLKNSLKVVLNTGSDDEGDEEWGGLFKKRRKTEHEKEKEEENYKEWLKGQKKDAPDKEVEKDMKPLHDYWTKPDLNEGDQFLRDYILNKKFLEHSDNDDSRVEIEQLLEEPEKEQDKFTNHHEESDHEFIKRYPRVMERSFRWKNDHRKKKREEVKERKLKEKKMKRAEIQHKKKLKKKEIEDKINELKKLTGNDKLPFEDVLDQDFNFDEHDIVMERIFNEEFYSQTDANFNPSGAADYEDAWNEEDWCEESGEMVGIGGNDELHCEDPNFNMDCDYNPALREPKDKTSRSRRRKDKHRRTTVSEAVNREKPTFDPTTFHSFQEYLDQYYAIDCEDFIGDLACRFKYRRTVPNSYGLTIEEILAADEKELERWCSIKRIHQLRPEYKEKGDLKVYGKKGADEELKRKILPSLYKPADDQKSRDPEKDETVTSVNENNMEENCCKNDDTSIAQMNSKSENTMNLARTKKNKKLRQSPESKKKENIEETNHERIPAEDNWGEKDDSSSTQINSESTNTASKAKTKKTKNQRHPPESTKKEHIEKTNHKRKHTEENCGENDDTSLTQINSKSTSTTSSAKIKKKKKLKRLPESTKKEYIEETNHKRKSELTEAVNRKNKKRKLNINNDQGTWSNKGFKKNVMNKTSKQKKASAEESSLAKMSDARLLAYGMNPKKFRNKLKYK